MHLEECIIEDNYCKREEDEVRSEAWQLEQVWESDKHGKCGEYQVSEKAFLRNAKWPLRNALTAPERRSGFVSKAA